MSDQLGPEAQAAVNRVWETTCAAGLASGRAFVVDGEVDWHVPPPTPENRRRHPLLAMPEILHEK